MKKFLVAASAVAVVLVVSVGAGASAGHRVCFGKPGKYPPGARVPTVCVDGPVAAAAYSGYVGCNIGSGLPSRWTVRCAWHSNIRRVVVWADVRHWGSVSFALGECAPGPCTSDSGYLGHEYSGTPMVGNTSAYTMHRVSAYAYQ